MNLNDCIAETTSLAEYCEDEKTKDILLNHLKELLDLQLREFKQPHKEQNEKLPIIFNCSQCTFRNKVKNTFSVNGYAVLHCKACGYCNTVNTRGDNES